MKIFLFFLINFSYSEFTCEIFNKKANYNEYLQVDKRCQDDEFKIEIYFPQTEKPFLILEKLPIEDSEQQGNHLFCYKIETNINLQETAQIYCDYSDDISIVSNIELILEEILNFKQMVPADINELILEMKENDEKLLTPIKRSLILNLNSETNLQEFKQDEGSNFEYSYTSKESLIKKIFFKNFYLFPMSININVFNEEFYFFKIESNKKNLELLVPKFKDMELTYENANIGDEFESEGEQETFIQGEKEYINKEQDYIKQIQRYLNGMFVDNQIDLTYLPEKIQPLLKQYAEKDLISLPIAILTIQLLMTQSDLSKEILDGPEQQELQEEIFLLNNFEFPKESNPEEENAKEEEEKEKVWFFLSNQNISQISKLLKRLEFPEKDEKVPQNQLYDKFLSFMSSNLKYDYNYYKMTFGIESLQQKIVVEIYGYEKSFFKSILVKFTSKFFESEHVISLESFQDFYEEILMHIKDSISHLHEILFELDLLDSGMTFDTTYDEINFYVSEYLDNNFCLLKKEDGTSIWMILNEKKKDYKQEPAYCQSDITNQSVEQLQKGIDFEEKLKPKLCKYENEEELQKNFTPILKIQEENINSKPGYKLNFINFSEHKKNHSLSMKFYSSHKFTYSNILNKNLKSKFCQYFTNKMNRQKIQREKLSEILGIKL